MANQDAQDLHLRSQDQELPGLAAVSTRGKRPADWDHARLTLALLNHVSSSFSVMVDCSKTSWGSGLVPFRLQKKLGRDFLLIHLVRDPRAVCWSTLRTKNQHEEPGSELGRYVRTAFGWLGANLACEAFRLLHPDQYLRIRYEDIVRAPQTTLPGIFEAAALQPSQLDYAVASDNRHQLHGNRVRRQPLVACHAQRGRRLENSDAGVLSLAYCGPDRTVLLEVWVFQVGDGTT